MKHLRYKIHEAADAGEKRHPEMVMADLGITYQHSTPQSIADQWWFWNCEDVPDELPPYLTELDLDPHDQVGYGLTEQQADAIASGTSTKDLWLRREIDGKRKWFWRDETEAIQEWSQGADVYVVACISQLAAHQPDGGKQPKWTTVAFS